MPAIDFGPMDITVIAINSTRYQCIIFHKHIVGRSDDLVVSLNASKS